MMAPDLYARSIQDSSTGGRFNLREKKMAGPSQSSRLCFCLIHTMLLGGLVSAGALAAQEPPKESATQDSGILLRQTVRRVRVDVVVIDAQDILLRVCRPPIFALPKTEAAVHPPVRIPER